MGKNTELLGIHGSPVMQDCRYHMGNENRKQYISAAALLPYTNGRALPSKWDDAERWITSPLSGPDSSKTSISQPQKQPKSKSGPLGFPSHPVTKEPSRTNNFVANSPLTTGVLLPNGVSIHYDASFPNLLDQTSAPNHQEEGQDSPVVLRRDMATQISPEGSSGSSSFSRLPFPLFASSLNLADQDEIRDVQVDKDRGRQYKNQQRKLNHPINVDDTPSPWNDIEASNNIKLQRYEARIAAWESSKKAKAHSAMQKLEMELEKKRSESMEKILKDLQTAQMKAQAMRDSLSDSQEHPTRLGKFKTMFAKIRPLTVLLRRRKHHSAQNSRSVLEAI